MPPKTKKLHACTKCWLSACTTSSASTQHCRKRHWHLVGPFIDGLESTDPQFPIHLWCRLIGQAIDTLNFLRQSRLHPQLLVYAHINGTFEFNRTSLAPLSIKVLIHEKSQVYRSWSPHGVDVCYLGLAKEHNRCHRLYYSMTGTKRILYQLNFSLPTFQ